MDATSRLAVALVRSTSQGVFDPNASDEQILWDFPQAVTLAAALAEVVEAEVARQLAERDSP